LSSSRDPLSGERVQLSGSAATERESVQLERRLRLQAESSVPGAAQFGEVAEVWWASRPGLSATTLANYRYNLDRHILPALGDKKIREIRPRLVAIFLIPRPVGC
jgi:hypothetical protein